MYLVHEILLDIEKYVMNNVNKEFENVKKIIYSTK